MLLCMLPPLAAAAAVAAAALLLLLEPPPPGSPFAAGCSQLLRELALLAPDLWHAGATVAGGSGGCRSHDVVPYSGAVEPPDTQRHTVIRSHTCG
jgi:hypothetical protein